MGKLEKVIARREVIYKIAEGEIDKNTVLVGADAKIGRALYLLTYPLVAYRFDYLFAAGSYLFYQGARLAKALRGQSESNTFEAKIVKR